MQVVEEGLCGSAKIQRDACFCFSKSLLKWIVTFLQSRDAPAGPPVCGPPLAPPTQPQPNLTALGRLPACLPLGKNCILGYSTLCTCGCFLCLRPAAVLFSFLPRYPLFFSFRCSLFLSILVKAFFFLLFRKKETKTTSNQPNGLIQTIDTPSTPGEASAQIIHPPMTGRKIWSCVSCTILLVSSIWPRDAAAMYQGTGQRDTVHRIFKVKVTEDTRILTDDTHELFRRKVGSLCPASYSLCAAELGGNCCPENYACAKSSCYATTAAVSTCQGRTAYYACPQSLQGGCCPQGECLSVACSLVYLTDCSVHRHRPSLCIR